MGKFFYEHLRDDLEFAEKIHDILCNCTDGSCGLLDKWANPGGESGLTLEDFEEAK